MTSLANNPKHYGYGGCWYFCPHCGFFDQENEASDAGPNHFKCENCGCVVGPKDREGELVDGVWVVRYGMRGFSNSNGIDMRLGHEPFLPDSLNQFHPFPVGMSVIYRRYPTELFNGVVVEVTKDDLKRPWVSEGQSCRVRFSNWVDPSWRGKRSSMPAGHTSEQLIGKGSLFTPKAGTQGELF